MAASNFAASVGRGFLPLMCVAGMMSSAVAGQNAASPYLQIALWDPIDSGKVKVGHAIDAKAAFDWEAPGCVLKKGAHLRGHVVDVQKASKDAPESHLALAIDAADCQGHHGSPVKLEIVEIIGADADNTERLIDVLPTKGTAGLVGQEKSSAIPLKSDDPIVVHPGEVHDVQGVTLRLGAGPQGSVLLTRSGGNIRLDTDTVMILSPANLAPVEVRLKTTDPKDPKDK